MAKRKVTREFWRAIPGYKGYEASSHGRIRSLPRSVMMSGSSRNRPWIRIFPGCVLKPQERSHGRFGVSLGRKKQKAVAQLVLLAFYGYPPKGKMYAVHNDGNPKNNHISNLRYDTQKSNMSDRIKHGTSNRGNRNGMNRLSINSVRIIKKGGNAIALSKKYNVSLGAIYHIWNGDTWRWVDGNG